MSDHEEGQVTVADHNDETAKGNNSQSLAWRMLLGTIRRTFPHAKQLKTRSLNTWLEDENKKKTVLLLDVRDFEEYDVSTLDGAILTKPDGSDLQKILKKVSDLKEAFPDQSVEVVCFCSLGYRSAKMAELIQANLSKEQKDSDSIKVYNLEGSLFKWANEGKPMVDKERKRTIFCHPYNIVWGKFLNSDYRKWTG